MQTFIFYVAAIATLASAVLCITRRSPVASALWLVGVLFSLSVLYVLLDAPFIAAVQILVYAGAIMVLFLFVIMLLNIGRPGPTDVRGPRGKVIALVGGLILAGELLIVRAVTLPSEITLPEGAVAHLAETQGAVGVLAQPLFREYLIPFELTSIMLLAAVVGAVVLAKRKV